MWANIPDIIFVTGTTGDACGENICHVEKFLHMKKMWREICLVTIYAVLFQNLFCYHLRRFVAKSIVVTHSLLRGGNWTRYCVFGEKGQISGIVGKLVTYFTPWTCHIHLFIYSTIENWHLALFGWNSISKPWPHFLIAIFLKQTPYQSLTILNQSSYRINQSLWACFYCCNQMRKYIMLQQRP